MSYRSSSNSETESKFSEEMPEYPKTYPEFKAYINNKIGNLQHEKN